MYSICQLSHQYHRILAVLFMEMEQNCFAKVIAEEHLGNFDAEYKGLDFLKGDLNFLKIQINGDFYNELLQARKKIQI